MKKKIIKTIIASIALTSGIPAESGTLTKIETETENELEEKDERLNSTKKRVKRQTPPSLQKTMTTINIGQIEANDKQHIIQRLREINHPILSREDF
ncbi:hypothetical protein [Spiroplasma endosymbiont of Dactylopius coccus]|nr:hypothetical protein [Spiroplasma ixodetis]